MQTLRTRVLNPQIAEDSAQPQYCMTLISSAVVYTRIAFSTNFLHDLLDLIENLMLVVDSEVRWYCDKVHDRLKEVLERFKTDERYC